MKDSHSATPNSDLQQQLRQKNAEIKQLKGKLQETVELLHIWKNHSLAYKKILEIHQIDASHIDQKVMDEFMRGLRKNGDA